MAGIPGQIVAIGGGGFRGDPRNPQLEDFIVSLTNASKPRVCFVPTASGDSDDYLVAFYNAFPSDRFQPSHLALFTRRVEDVDAFLRRQDIIYVGGGNTANLLLIWRLHGLDRVMREVLANGTVLCGVSAGALCWFQDGVTDSFGPGYYRLNDGLGFLEGNFTPHWDGESSRQPVFRQLIQDTNRFGYAVEDYAAMHFKDGVLVEVVASRPTARAYRFEPGPNGVTETELPSRYLGA